MPGGPLLKSGQVVNPPSQYCLPCRGLHVQAPCPQPSFVTEELIVRSPDGRAGVDDSRERAGVWAVYDYWSGTVVCDMPQQPPLTDKNSPPQDSALASAPYKTFLAHHSEFKARGHGLCGSPGARLPAGNWQAELALGARWESAGLILGEERLLPPPSNG